jgi:hypothetical protein
MTPFERRLRDLVNPVSTRLTGWWSNSAARKALLRSRRGGAGQKRLPGTVRDLRNSETARKVKATAHDLRASETARKAQATARDLRQKATVGKAQEVVKDLRESDRARKAQATVKETVKEAETAVRAAYDRMKRPSDGS